MLWHKVCYVLVNILCMLDKNVCCVGRWSVLPMSIRSTWLIVLINYPISLLVSVYLIYKLLREVLKSPTIIVDFSFKFYQVLTSCISKFCCWDFPGGAVVKNPPANAGNMGSSPVWEGPTCWRATKPMRHNYWAHALEPESHNYWAHAPQLLKPARLKPVLHNKEKPPQWEAHVPQWRVAPAHCN